MLAGRLFGVPGLPCLYTDPGGVAAVAGAAGTGELFAILSRLTSVPSSFLRVTFWRGTKVFEPAFRRGIDVDEGVDGGEVRPPMELDAWESAGGGCGAWTGLGRACACDSVGVPGGP